MIILVIRELTKLIFERSEALASKCTSYPYQIRVDITCDAIVITFGVCFDNDKARFGEKM